MKYGNITYQRSYTIKYKVSFINLYCIVLYCFWCSFNQFIISDLFNQYFYIIFYTVCIEVFHCMFLDFTAWLKD